VSVVANVAINVDSRNAVSKLREVQSQAGATEKAFNGVAAAAGKLAVAFGALQAFKFVFAKTAELESQTRSLEVLTGSAEKAGQIIKELQQLGAVTPFTSTELIDSAKRLQAFGIQADKVVETTKRLADVSGATGAELQGLVTAYGQVQAKGRLQGEELLQFQERGVALQEELRKMYGLSGEEFQKALSKGRIGAEAVEVAVIRLTNAGGKYANGAIAQSDTLAGKWSTLTDGVEMLAKTIGETLKPALKETLDFATMVVDKINQALAGPDYKKANDQLFNTRARIKELQAAIKAGEAAGIGTQSGAPVLGVDGQVMGGGQPALPGMKYELQQLQKEAQKLEQRLGSLRQQSKPDKPAATTPATPALLPETEKEKRSKALNIDDLIGGNIGRRLQEQQARLSAATAKMMNTAAASENPQQAQRMVEYSSKLLNIKYQIGAIDETLTKRAEVRAEIIASEQDKARAALAFDETTNDLKIKRLGLELEINTLLAEQTGKAEEQYRQQQEAIADALANLDMQRIKVSAVTEAQKQALQLLEIENTLKKAGIVLTDADRQALGLKIAEIQKLTKEQEAAKTAAQQLKDVYTDIGMSIKSGIVDAIQGAVDGTKTLGEVASGVLKNIANKVLDVAINFALFGAMSGTGTGGGLLGGLFMKRANGGPVTGGSTYLVGERGPELFVPGRSGSIVPNDKLGSGGSTSVVVNVDASGSKVEGNDQQGNQLGRVIAAAVQQELIKQKRPGGLLV
jgi:tape measure domain-containing protein